MDAVQIHLVLNHVPILGTLFGTAVFLTGLLLKNENFIKVGLVTFILVAIATVPVILSGEEAEHTIKKLTCVNLTYIESHEEMANKAFWSCIGLGVISVLLMALFYVRKSNYIAIKVIILILALGTLGAMIETGNRGGKISHSQTQSTISSKPENTLNSHSDSEDHENEDEED